MVLIVVYLSYILTWVLCVCNVTEDLPEDEVKGSLDKLKTEWNNTENQIQELNKGILYQDSITAYFKELDILEEKLRQEEEWLNTQPLPSQELPLQSLKDARQVKLYTTALLHLHMYICICISIAR